MKPSRRPRTRISSVTNPPSGTPASRSRATSRRATVFLPIPGRASSSTLSGSALPMCTSSPATIAPQARAARLHEPPAAERPGGEWRSAPGRLGCTRPGTRACAAVGLRLLVWRRSGQRAALLSTSTYRRRGASAGADRPAAAGRLARHTRARDLDHPVRLMLLAGQRVILRLAVPDTRLRLAGGRWALVKVFTWVVASSHRHKG